MTDLLDAYRPAWLDAAAPAGSDDLTGCTLDLTLHESAEGEQLVVTATAPDGRWRVVLEMTALESSLGEAASGIESELTLGDDVIAVRPVDGVGVVRDQSCRDPRHLRLVDRGEVQAGDTDEDRVVSPERAQRVEPGRLLPECLRSSTTFLANA